MSHHAPRLEDAVMTRRELLCLSGMGMGALALGDMLAEQGLLSNSARAADNAPGATPSGPAVRSIGSANPILPKASPLRARARLKVSPPVHERRTDARRHI